MEDALARVGRCPYVACAFSVLILVVMEDALARLSLELQKTAKTS